MDLGRDEMIGYSNWQAPLYKDESRSVKHLDIPLYARFEVLSPISVNGLWQVEYVSNGKTLIGYIEDRFMEWYEQGMPNEIVDIESLQTPELNDAQQYIFWDGIKQTNMCGEMCVADVLKIPLIDVLTKWRTVDPPFYKRIFPSGKKATGTIHDDIIKMYGLFGHTARRINLPKYTPRIFSELVKNSNGVTVSVHLNTQTGALNGGGVLHWVNVLEVVTERLDMGHVLIYNPFGNAHEWYSWREFLATTRSPYGVIV